MNFWQRLLFLLGFLQATDIAASSECSIELDTKVVVQVRALAEREQLAVGEVASNLLAFALKRHSVNETQMYLWYTLSGRERQVIAMVCQNRTNQEIADRLCISQETVKSHIRHGIQKLGLQNKTELLRASVDWDFGDWEKDDFQF